MSEMSGCPTGPPKGRRKAVMASLVLVVVIPKKVQSVARITWRTP
jgi:hypothetical protein